jgi:hypothetical protein
MTTQSVEISLASPTWHAGIVRSSTPLTVETPAAQWSYSVSVPLRAGIHPNGPLHLPVVVSADVSVHSGELGCILVGPDWKTLLGPLAPPVASGHHKISLLLEHANENPYMVFRNAGRGNHPCVCTINSVSLSPDQGDSLQWVSSLDDVMEGTPPRISMEKLRAAIVRSGKD